MIKKITMKAARAMRGKTQREMAESLDVSITTYASWENGKSKIPMRPASKFCDILGFVVDDIAW